MGKLMKIYVVSHVVAYDGSNIYATFSTNDKAEWFLRNVPKITKDGKDFYVISNFKRFEGLNEYFEIEEYEIDEFMELRTAERKKWILHSLEGLLQRRNQLKYKGEFKTSSLIRTIHKDFERYYKERDKYLDGKYLMSFLDWEKKVDPIYCNPDDKYYEIRKHSLKEYVPGDNWCSECGVHIKDD